jgi:RNA polymerase sigma-70 factor (ECF subfamily)
MVRSAEAIRSVTAAGETSEAVDGIEGVDFTRDAERYRRALLAHCYRMLGTWDEAEDVVQESLLRAWRAYDTLENKHLLRMWLYRIATNACLTALQQRGRRALPAGLGAPNEDPDLQPADADQLGWWIQPLPDRAVIDASDDPAAIIASREGVRLALVASLQHLAPRQRAVLILRDVLGFRAAEVASMLDTTTVAIKSALQRARLRMEEVSSSGAPILEPEEPRARELLAEYIAGFENADMSALERALRADAAIEMVPSGTWFAGKIRCLRFLSESVGNPGDWRMTPAVVNGQPAAAAYRRGKDSHHHAYGFGVLTATATGISRISVFGDAALVERFGFPAVL